MKSKNEKIICCEVKKIHKPKPKKMFKINDCYKGNIKCNPGHRKMPNYNHDIYKKRRMNIIIKINLINLILIQFL